jgi:peptidoglycan/LPS O-acetylase OafA/YrhL
MFKDWEFVFIPGAYFSVDVFFFLSGFLGVYLMTEKLYPKKGKASYPLIYLHRYLRLIPALVFSLFMCWWFLPYVVPEGPAHQMSFTYVEG